MFARLSRFNARAWNYRQLFEVARSRRSVVIASAVAVALGGAALLWPSAPAAEAPAKKSITWKAFAPKKKTVAAKPKVEPSEEPALNMPSGMTMKPVTPPAAPVAAAPPKVSNPPKASNPPKPVAAVAKPVIVKSTSPVPVAQGGVAVKPAIRSVVKPPEAASPVVAAKPVSAPKVRTAKPAAVAARAVAKSNRPPASDVASASPAPTATATAPPAPPAAAAGTATADPLGPLFIDEQNGFSMRFPARWALRSLGSEGWVLDCGDAKTGLISVGFSPFPAGFTAETIPASWVARRIQNRGDTTLHAQGYATIGGRKALWNKSTGPLPMSNGSPRMTRVNYILPLNDGRVLELRVASTPEAFDKLVPLMRKAVETFRFTAPQAPSATVKKETVVSAE